MNSPTVEVQKLVDRYCEIEIASMYNQTIEEDKTTYEELEKIRNKIAELISVK